LHHDASAGASRRAPLRFWKGQALGNDYIVMEREVPPSPAVIRALCDRHHGVGSDGVLVGQKGLPPVPLRIFNPDGTEAEKSGNGLRIFGAWLNATGRAAGPEIQVSLPGEEVSMWVEGVAADGSRRIRVAMGRAVFSAAAVEYSGGDAATEVIGERLELDGEPVEINLVSVGNPHCVVFRERLDPAEFRRLAPRLQADPRFRRGVNVQFARPAGDGVVEAMIWERGAGETLASGSSACAVVAAAVRSGRGAAGEFRVVMPGGSVDVAVDAAWGLQLSGPAQVVYEGEVPAEVVSAWESGTGAVP
jgi:diaminopimelate epimerase